MLDPKAISQYYNKIIDVVKTINSVQSEEKQKLPNMTFGKLISKGHALHNLKIDGQGIPPDGSSTKSPYKKKIELYFSTPDIESIEGSDLREGEKVFILRNKQPYECFKPDNDDLRGTVSKIEDNRITIEANVEMNFDIDNYNSKDIYFVIYDYECDSNLELENLKHLSEVGDFCNQSLLSLIIKSDKIAIMDEDGEKFHPINNETAIKEALRSENLYLIHGPPGTGKTVTCTKIIADFIP